MSTGWPRLLARLGPRRTSVVLVTALAFLAAGLVAAVGVVRSMRSTEIAVGRPEDPTTTLPVTTLTSVAGVGTLPPAPVPEPGGPPPSIEDGPGLDPAGRPRAEPRSRPGLVDPDGRPYGSPVPFNGSIAVPRNLVWVLFIGSDARPGERVDRSRADSIHLVAVNPATGQGTVVGFPRDSWIEIPGRGMHKVNEALVLGGPSLLADAIHRYTGLPVQYWVLAGFEGFKRVVDSVGGVDVYVDRRMDDPFSGARFNVGWHHFDGEDALAYSRNRYDTAQGDLSRSENHGKLLLASLGKLRAEVADEAGLRRWISFAVKHLSVDVPKDEMLGLLALARGIAPGDVTNLVLPGTPGKAGNQSVVYLDARRVAEIADDLRPDATIGRARGATTTTSTTAATTTTTASPTTTTTAPPATVGTLPTTSTSTTAAPSGSTTTRRPSPTPTQPG